ncbi:methyltransferase family protein [Kribbella orskensis]|uniref:Methyltransferase family protein n=1 Tax=Kribbella orskensis TaxID=2512216 RepID=A0ABY2BNQ4_9ACTN|nr:MULTISPECIES: class I SAM-dependent methyltransferase [Kribbella]TCN41891.1 methyltransferase family protein [Kribbella sp. VKM Ac-2500]TCO25769.1 methyltransferase family protein [Kribbella orskensis]
MSNLTSEYEQLADEYHGTVDPEGAGLEDPTFDGLVGDVRGQRVAAVACGQGRDARRLADLGAEVVGIDASESLLAHARRFEQETPRGIEYVHGDAHDLRRLPDASFDGVVCHMALMDIPELEPALRSIARILVPGGWFVASIVHPCYKPPAHGELVDHVDGFTRRITGRYFEEGPYNSVTRWAILPRVSYHRTLSTYVNTLVAAGLPLTRMEEPVGDRPVWKEAAGILYFRCELRQPA